MKPHLDPRSAKRPGQPDDTAGKPGDDKDGTAASDMPPAGPHATPELTNEDATPGAGYLPKVTREDEADPAGG